MPLAVSADIINIVILLLAIVLLADLIGSRVFGTTKLDIRADLVFIGVLGISTAMSWKQGNKAGALTTFIVAVLLIITHAADRYFKSYGHARQHARDLANAGAAKPERTCDCDMSVGQVCASCYV